jgi:hypothetical protein
MTPDANTDLYCVIKSDIIFRRRSGQFGFLKSNRRVAGNRHRFDKTVTEAGNKHGILHLHRIIMLWLMSVQAFRTGIRGAT